jgi:hypothetical protein
MKPVTRIAMVAAFASALGACASDPYYSQNRYRTGYGPNYAYSYQQPTYAYSQPAYYSAPGYRTTTYTTYPQPQPQVYYSPQRSSYDGYWDYQRNYRGIGAAPEFSRM